MARTKRSSLEAPMLLREVVANTSIGRAAARIVISRSLWQEVAGIAFAQRTRPGKLVRGTLHVMVHSSSWAHELSLHEVRILERLRRYGVEVQKLKFYVTKVDSYEYKGLQAPSQKELQATHNCELSPQAQHALKIVEDESLRSTLETTAHKALRHQMQRELNQRAATENRPIPSVPNNVITPLLLEHIDNVKSTSKLP